jgi:Ribbon-helix-helix protein, copG family
MIWCMKRTNLYLETRQCDALDGMARAEGVSRAEIVRRIIDRAIDGGSDDDLLSDLDAIDASFGVLDGSDGLDEILDAPRGPDARSEHLARIRSGR